MQNSGSRLHVPFIFLIALMLRCTLFLGGPARDLERALEPDSGRYLQLAKVMVHSGRFAKSSEDGLVHLAIERMRAKNGTLPAADDVGLRPEIFRTPGYPLFLATILRTFGDARWALFLQNLIGASTAIWVIMALRGLGVSNRSADVGGLIWAIHPALITFDNMIYSDSLFSCMLIATLALAARRETYAILAAAMLLGLASLVRPLGLLYLPALCCMRWGAQRGWRPVYVAIITIALIPSLVWSIRNERSGAGFRVSTVADVNLLYYFANYTISQNEGRDWMVLWEPNVHRLAADLEGKLSPGQDVYAAGSVYARRILADHPGPAAVVLAKACGKLLLAHSTGSTFQFLGIAYEPSGIVSQLLGERGGAGVKIGIQLVLASIWVCLNALIVVLAFVGTIVAIRRSRWRVLIVGMITVLLFIAATNAVGSERFRLPMIFPLIVLACEALDGSRARLDRAREKRC